MLALDFKNQICATAMGHFGEARRGVIFPGPSQKLVGHIHQGWHITVILDGVGILRTPTGTVRVAKGDATEIEAHEVHELEALFGPLEYMCIGVKGF